MTCALCVLLGMVLVVAAVYGSIELSFYRMNQRHKREFKERHGWWPQ